jgi:hypothetical protein
VDDRAVGPLESPVPAEVLKKPKNPGDRPIPNTPSEKALLRRARNNRTLRRITQAAGNYDANAVDGDNDGVVQDGTAFQRPVAAAKRVFKALKTRRRKSEERNDFDGLLKRLKDPDSGFSVSVSSMRDVKSGW